MNILNNLQGAYHQLLPGDNRTYATNSAAESASKKKTTTTTKPKYNTGNDDAAAKMIADLQKSLAGYDSTTAALRAQLAAQPRLPTFDYSANYARAQSTAASTVNPVYEDKLNQYLKGKQLKINQQTETSTRNKEDIGTALAQALEDAATERNRTSEDTETTLGDITANEGSFQRQEGRQFDAARTALLGDVANAGLTESGLGQGSVATATTDRNLASEDQTREFNNQRRDTNTAFTRKMSDLDKVEGRQKGSSARKTEDEDIALRNFIDNQNYDEELFRVQNETERAGAINSATQSAYDRIIAQTIASLAGSGSRAQDIALFKQVYG